MAADPYGGQHSGLRNEPGVESHAQVSYLPERTAIPTWMSTEQLVDFYQDFYQDFRKEAAEEMLHHLGIQPRQRSSR
mgnify:CR=1 FL=1